MNANNRASGPSHRQLMAVAALVGHSEAVAGSGLLPTPSEQSLRFLIAETLSAFDMPAAASRAS
jgi:hypothetical protein